MAKSVGMFQRPVSYKLNCLEMVYEFSGLELEYSYLSSICSAFTKITRSSTKYFGRAMLNLCFSNKKKEVIIKFFYDANFIYLADSYHSECSMEAFEELKIVHINSYEKKIKFYEKMIDWIKDELVVKGYDRNKINDYKFLFDFDGYDYSTGTFYIHSGSNRIPHTYVTTSAYTPVGLDEFGHTIWVSNNHVGAIPVDMLELFKHYLASLDLLTINVDGLTINSSDEYSVDFYLRFVDYRIKEVFG